VIKEPATASNAAGNKKASRDFNDPFRFEPTPKRSPTAKNGAHVDPFSNKTSSLSSGGKSASGWDVFKSTPVQDYGHGRSATWSGAGNSSHESSHSFHVEEAHGGSSGGGHEGHEEHHKK
jgi:hypothetical protein